MKGFILSLTLFLLSFLADAQLAGNSLQLKANGNFVSVADASSASLNDTMTMEMMLYFRCNNIQSTHLMTKGWCGNGDWSFYWSVYDNKIRFSRWATTFTGGCSGNQAIFETTDSISVNTWTHVAVVIQDLDVKIYIDGEDANATLISGVNGDGFNPCTHPIRIGNYLNASSQNVGTPKSNMDEIRIWHKAKTQAEVQAQMNTELIGNEAGLVAYWKLNESGSGAGISVVNSATATSGLFNGSTVGSAANLEFNNNAMIQNSLPTCDPVLWLKADEGVTYNGSNQVSQWNDQSGFNNHVSQANPMNMPIYQSNVINDKPSIYFDGAAGKYFLNNTATNLVNSGLARTVFVSARRDCKSHGSGVVGGSLFSFRRSGLMNILSYGVNFYGGPLYIYSDNNGIGNNNAFISPSAIDTGMKNFVATYQIPNAGNQMQFRLNKIVQLVNQGSGSITVETGATGFTVGDREDQIDLDWTGWINEVIVFNRTLSNTELNAMENYLRSKYPQEPTIFSATYTLLQHFNTSIMDDGEWKHSYNNVEANKVIASIKDNCLDLGTRTDTVYIESNPVQIGSSYAMRRHYTIQTSLNPIGTKRVRLYYTNADFTNLQTMVPGLTSHSQLVVTKYDGPNEDGIFNTAGGTVTLIPSAQITTGTAFGQRYLEFDVTDFSEFWIHTGSVPLPVQILDFTVSHCQSNACLQWMVGEEKNVRQYEIEKSADGVSFERVDNVEAMHKSSYTFTDTKPYAGRNYYRLKVMDIDGKYDFSTIRSLDFADGQWNVSILPTYSESGLYTLQSNKRISGIQVYSINGSLLRSIQATSNILDLSDLSSGLYFIKINTSLESEVLKVRR